MSQVDTNAGASDVLVSFRGVQKSYDGENLIVKDLNLDIRKGEFLTLLGPSGSGKTTSLMMLAGFETPTAGEILLAGRSINNVPPHKRDIGMVFQNYALFPHMTVAENLAFPLTVRGLNKSDVSDRVKKVLSMVQLDAFASRYPAQLSGGQQQRVALARALVFEPQLVLMDEPLGALDKQLREHMQMEIKHLHQRLGVTVVYVTHDQGEALTMSDRVAVFHQGEIQQIAPPRTPLRRTEKHLRRQLHRREQPPQRPPAQPERRALRGRVGPWRKGRGAGGQCRPDRRTGDPVDPSGARQPQRFERSMRQPLLREGGGIHLSGRPRPGAPGSLRQDRLLRETTDCRARSRARGR
jgi:ABC-type proline/glycine betaine transport system ATPase subunit